MATGGPGVGKSTLAHVVAADCEQSAFVTGATLRVDGGTLAAPGWFRRDGSRFTYLPRPLR